MASPTSAPSTQTQSAVPKTASKTQFKATEKWCELIAAFRNGMPVGKHWHMFHWAEDTFTGSEAVEWMFTYLKSCPEFSKVTKENALQLLQKFLDAGIMEELKKSKGKFEYSGRLYKMIGDSPPQPRPHNNASHVKHSTKNALGHANDGYQSDSDLRSVIAANAARMHLQKKRDTPNRPLSEEDVHLQWKMAVVSKFEDIFGRGTASTLFDVKLLSGANVFFNATHVAANGMLSDLPPAGDLPEWVISSLNFLSRWTDEVGNNLPHYPGVEADLLRVIVQSFENIPEPLIPYVFHKLVLFSVAPDLLTIDTSNSWKQQFHMFQQPTQKNNLRFESIENLLIDMASLSIVGCPSPILPNAAHHAPRASRQQSLTQSGTHGGAAHPRSHSNSRYNIRLETAFVGPNNETYTTFKFEETKPTQNVGARQLSSLNNSAHFGDTSSFNGQQQYTSGARCQSVQNLVWQPMNAPNPHIQHTLDRSSVSASNNMRPFGSNLENIASIKHADSTSSLPIAVDLACEEIRDNSSRLNNSRMPQIIDPVTSLQMTLLFMPPPERRRLQMFLRLLSRLLENKLICHRLAPPHGDLRSLLVSMFAPAFVRPKPGEEASAMYHRLAVERLSALLLDKHAAIFAVPDWLTSDVNGRLEKLRRLRSEMANSGVSSPVASGVNQQQSPSTPSPRSVPAFCQRISMREYKRQSSVNPRGDDDADSSSPTHDSLFELLASIANNKELSKKERAKRLKEFEKVYPDIYNEYFASLESSSSADLEESVASKENNSNNNSPSSDIGGGKSAPWMPRIKEPMLLKKIRARFGTEQQPQQ